VRRVRNPAPAVASASLHAAVRSWVPAVTDICGAAGAAAVAGDGADFDLLLRQLPMQSSRGGHAPFHPTNRQCRRLSTSASVRTAGAGAGVQAAAAAGSEGTVAAETATAAAAAAVGIGEGGGGALPVLPPGFAADGMLVVGGTESNIVFDTLQAGLLGVRLPSMCCPVPILSCPVPTLSCPVPTLSCPVPTLSCPVPTLSCPVPTSQHSKHSPLLVIPVHGGCAPLLCGRSTLTTHPSPRTLAPVLPPPRTLAPVLLSASHRFRCMGWSADRLVYRGHAR
jgi:hypothetical protein